MMALGDGASPTRQESSRRFLSLLGNVLVALFYAVFLYSNVQFWLRTGSLVGLGLVIVNTMLVACMLFRRYPMAVTGSVRNWILAPLTQIMPLLLRPVGTALWPVLAVSTGGQVAGLIIMIVAMLSLNRSIGIVAANRGVKTGGPYAWVRHPLYAGEILFFASYLISNWGYQNALLVSLIILGQVVRSRQEEALLARDERYAAYKSTVHYRLIPGVF
jgi:protein-S-isoprenylcysteine O-methyltransferase Ste14